ncbi:MAG: hypothetical protein U1E28_21900 [Beijerinckiaceae bacterium]
MSSTPGAQIEPVSQKSFDVISPYLAHEFALAAVERHQLARLRGMGLLRKRDGARDAKGRLEQIESDDVLQQYEKAIEDALGNPATPDEIRAIVAFVCDSTSPRRKVHPEALLQATALVVAIERMPVAVLAGAALDLIRKHRTWPVASDVVEACRARRSRLEIARETIKAARIVRNNADQVARAGAGGAVG